MTLREINVKIEQLIKELYRTLPEPQDPRVAKSIDTSIRQKSWLSAYWGMKSLVNPGEKSDRFAAIKELLDLYDVVGNKIVKSGLTEQEIKILGECLKASAEGPFFPDWEFNTLFGLERSEVKIIADGWPEVDSGNELLSRAINNSLNNLLGYPHEKWSSWKNYIAASPEDVEVLFDKWLLLKSGAAFEDATEDI